MTTLAVTQLTAPFPPRQTPSEWVAALLFMYRDLTRARLHSEARAMRQRFAQKVRVPQQVEPGSLPREAISLIRHLDVSRPAATLAWSMAITDQAIKHVLATTKDPLRAAGLVGALLERELWELPAHTGGMVQNMTLSRLTGVYFTPPSVAWYITVRTIGPFLERALSSEDSRRVLDVARATILDPGAGAGVFLAAALQLFLRFYDHISRFYPDFALRLGSRATFAKRIGREQLFGVDISKRACEVARATIATVAGCAEAEVAGIVHGDALRVPGSEDARDMSQRSPRPGPSAVDWNDVLPGGLADFVLLNPPFGRLRAIESELYEKSRSLNLSRREKRALLSVRKANYERVSGYFRSLDLYRPACGGILDWQRIFLVRALSLLRPNGAIGAIVPVSVIADRSARRFREYLFESTALVRLDRITETAKLFPGVNQPTCVLVAAKRGPTSDFVTTRPIRTVPPRQQDEFPITVAAVRKVSPDTLAVPGLDPAGWSVLEKLHRWPRLGDDARILNLRGELDLTFYRRFIGRGRTRLIRGDQIERFRVRPSWEGIREGYVDGAGFVAALGNSPKASHITRARLVGRQCAFLEKKRRLSFAPIQPGSVVANSCNYLIWNGPREKEGLLFLAGVLNSLVVEWRFRLTSSNNHVNNYELDDLPIPEVDLGPVSRCSRRLIAHYAGRPFGASASGTGELEDQLDAAVFRAYRLDVHDVERILAELAPHRIESMIRLLEA